MSITADSTPPGICPGPEPPERPDPRGHPSPSPAGSCADLERIEVAIDEVVAAMDTLNELQALYVTGSQQPGGPFTEAELIDRISYL